jgi:hypothetical protein
MSLIMAGYDASRLGAISFTLTETGGGGATGTVTLTGQYIHGLTSLLAAVEVEDPQTGEVSTLSLGYTSLPLAVVAAMDAIGNASYSMAIDATGVYTISASGGGVTSFALSAVSVGAQRMLGHSAESGALFYVGARPAWHYTVSTVGGFSEWTESEDDIGGETLVGSDGSTRGLVAVGSARRLDFVVPLEPMAKVWTDSASSTAWTWQRFFQRVRTVEPIMVLDPRNPASYVVGYLRHDACVLRPRLAATDYLAFQSIPVGMYVIGNV